MKMYTNFISSATMAVLLFLTGCGTADPATDAIQQVDGETIQEYMECARVELENADNYTAFLHAEIKMDENEDSTHLEAEIKSSTQPLAMNVLAQTYYGAQLQWSETYLEVGGKGANIYVSYDNEWTELSLNLEDAMKSVSLYNVQNQVGTLLTYSEEWDVEESDADGTLLAGTIPVEQIYRTMEDGCFLQVVGMNGIAETYYAGAQPITVHVQLNKEGTVASCSVDLTQVLHTVANNVMREIGGEGTTIKVETYLLRSEIEKINETEPIEAPLAVKDNAINYEREISLQESNEGEIDAPIEMMASDGIDVTDAGVTTEVQEDTALADETVE